MTGIEDFLEAQRRSALTDAEDATKQLEGLLRIAMGRTPMQHGENLVAKGFHAEFDMQ